MLLVPTWGLCCRCFSFKECRLVATHPVEPSQSGCKIRERGRPWRFTVATVHQTMRRTRFTNSASISVNDCTSIPLPLLTNKISRYHHNKPASKSSSGKRIAEKTHSLWRIGSGYTYPDGKMATGLIGRSVLSFTVQPLLCHRTNKSRYRHKSPAVNSSNGRLTAMKNHSARTTD